MRMWYWVLKMGTNAIWLDKKTIHWMAYCSESSKTDHINPDLFKYFGTMTPTFPAFLVYRVILAYSSSTIYPSIPASKGLFHGRWVSVTGLPRVLKVVLHDDRASLRAVKTRFDLLIFTRRKRQQRLAVSSVCWDHNIWKKAQMPKEPQCA